MAKPASWYEAQEAFDRMLTQKDYPSGATWFVPTGATWLNRFVFGVVASLAMFATSVAPASAEVTADVATETRSAGTEVGLLSATLDDTSNISTLRSTYFAKSVVELSELRETVLQTYSDVLTVPVYTQTTFLTSPSLLTPTYLEPIAVTVPSTAFGTGKGIDVALIDTGVAPVEGLTGRDKILHGPDLSGEGGSPATAYIDTYGHGTHMAGIIAGDRSGATGIAPDARLVSIKVAGHDGITTIPQVVAAIDWVVEHRDTDGMNIRVLNLSLGQQGVETHHGDLLSAAVERAWHAGIFVVVAGGNDGEGQAHLDSPAIDPYVMSVGAIDTAQSSLSAAWTVPNWSAQGTKVRRPDLVAPGVSIASYRVPGSAADTAAPWARHGEGFFRGSGTSQAAATVSGVAAVMFSMDSSMTNDDLKARLTGEAQLMRNLGHVTRQGHGAMNALQSVRSTAQGEQKFTPAAGPGSGIATPTSPTWTGGTWSDAAWSGATWSGATWSGATWSGKTWRGATWSGATWSGATWSGGTWSGATWSGATWSGATWSGATWSGKGWVSN